MRAIAYQEATALIRPCLAGRRNSRRSAISLGRRATHRAAGETGLMPQIFTPQPPYGRLVLVLPDDLRGVCLPATL